MHVLFIHPRYPAQFGHVARYLATAKGWLCTFATNSDAGESDLPFRRIGYQVSDAGLPRGYPTLATLPGLQAHMEALNRRLRGLPRRPHVRFTDKDTGGESKFGVTSMLYRTAGDF